jgi:hypothetical protein
MTLEPPFEEDPLATLDFEITGKTITDIRRQATELVTEFADGHPFRVAIDITRPRIFAGGRVAAWEASCSAVIYPLEQT